MPRILVTGGLGYIGSHTVVELLAAKYDVTIIDNLSNSDVSVLERIEKIAGVRPDFFQGDIRDKVFLNEIFSATKFDAVIHFAALKSVADSFAQRDEYFDVNVEGTRALLDVMEAHAVKRIVYSSTAAVYGTPETSPISETAELRPANPYGETKVVCEKLLEERAQSGEWGIVMLRYFNPVGAHESGLIGESSKLAVNIASNIMEVIRGTRAFVQINGDDYNTPDGTCIRDYIHVVDLAQAHLAALSRVITQTGASIFNVGTGQGHSVKEIVAAFSRAAGREIPAQIGSRRMADVVAAVADPKRINSELQWHATRTLKDMAESAVKWIANS